MHLFLLAHQDDDVFLTCRILAALRANDEVACIYLTDGGPLSELRNRESHAVLTGLGVAPNRIYCLGTAAKIPDGTLYEHLEAAHRALHQALDQLPAPSTVMTHAWEGGHQDHDCVHALTVVAAAVRGWSKGAYQVPFYRAISGSKFGFIQRAPLAENGPVTWIKRSWHDELITIGSTFRYKSQWKTFVQHTPAMILRRLQTNADPLQPLSLRRIGERPHLGQLYYERKGWAEPKIVMARIDAFVKDTLRA